MVRHGSQASPSDGPDSQTVAGRRYSYTALDNIERTRSGETRSGGLCCLAPGPARPRPDSLADEGLALLDAAGGRARPEGARRPGCRLASGKYGYADTMLVIRHGKVVYDRAYKHDYERISGEEARKLGPLNPTDPSGPYNYFNP
jgi:hypothetical protein